jgi:hypothetical protein
MPASKEQQAWVERVLDIRTAGGAGSSVTSRQARAGALEDPLPDATDNSPSLRDLADLLDNESVPLEQRIVVCADCREVRQTASEVRQGAATAEPVLTALIGETAGDCGGTMVGLQFRLKQQDSLARKIATDIVKTGMSPEEAAGGISDAVRYTCCFAPEEYTAGVTKVLNELREGGNKIKKLKNAWVKKIPYKGINVQLIDPQGQAFELQFHTERSFNVKDKETHHIYEEMRLLDPSSDRWNELNQQQMDIVSQVPLPDGVDTIQDI